MDSYLVLIRHGITEGNIKKWFYGKTDIPLTDEGKENLMKAKEEGIYPKVPKDTQFITSGLKRTNETLEILYGNCEYVVMPDIREMNFGDFECHSFAELEDDPNFSKWVWDKSGETPTKNGESRIQFKKRVKKGLVDIINLHRLKELSHRHSGKPAVTVVICHGGVISAMMEEMFPKQKQTMWDWIPTPGLGYIIDIKAEAPLKYRNIEA